MYLTKENLRTIEKYLAEKGVKDSHFPAKYFSIVLKFSFVKYIIIFYLQVSY